MIQEKDHATARLSDQALINLMSIEVRRVLYLALAMEALFESAEGLPHKTAETMEAARAVSETIRMVATNIDNKINGED